MFLYIFELSCTLHALPILLFFIWYHKYNTHYEMSSYVISPSFCCFRFLSPRYSSRHTCFELIELCSSHSMRGKFNTHIKHSCKPFRNLVLF
jgi:hypothetical protein